MSLQNVKEVPEEPATENPVHCNLSCCGECAGE